MKIKAPEGWDLALWREASETGLDCLLVKEDPDFELIIEDRTYDKGVRSIGPDKQFLRIMHIECIKSLTEPNPEWHGDHSDKPMFKKPKDLGYSVEFPHLTTTICLGDRKEAQRLERCRAKLVRAVIHAFVFLSLIRKELP